jgi:(+)-trans-carveol dehydrogenase
MRFAATSTNLLPIPWIEPEDISHGVLYLASDDARYVTGVTMPIDAGMSAQPSGIPDIGAELIAELSDAKAGGW